MRGKDGDFVPETLEAYCCIDDEALCAADTQIRVKENDAFGLGNHWGPFRLDVMSKCGRNDLVGDSRFKPAEYGTPSGGSLPLVVV